MTDRSSRPEGPDEEYEYPFTEDSIVLDLGGYKGDFAGLMRELYNCFVCIYEPVPVSYERLRFRFRKDNKVVVFPYGVGANSRRDSIWMDVNNGASCSFHNKGLQANTRQDVMVVGIDLIIKHLTPRPRGYGGLFDLIKINIEGEEFPLLRYMIDSGVVALFRNIQVQFHRFYPDADALVGGLAADLKKTHEHQWGVPYRWENWRLRDE